MARPVSPHCNPYPINQNENSDLQIFSLLEVADELWKLSLEIEGCWKPLWPSFEPRFRVGPVFGSSLETLTHPATDDAEKVLDGQNVLEGELVDPFVRSNEAELPE